MAVERSRGETVRGDIGSNENVSHHWYTYRVVSSMISSVISTKET